MIVWLDVRGFGTIFWSTLGFSISRERMSIYLAVLDPSLSSPIRFRTFVIALIFITRCIYSVASTSLELNCDFSTKREAVSSCLL